MTLGNPASQRHPYYIVAPDYRDSSAGVRVMHHLCHMLNSCGEEAYVIGAQSFDARLKTPPLSASVSARHAREMRVPIAVYPEIVSGNPLNSSVCVRYMLNKEGVINGNSMHAGPNDLFFYYSRAFVPDPQGTYDYLRLNTHDLDLFKPDPERRKTGPLLYLNRIPASSIDWSQLPRDIEVLSNRTPLSLPELAARLQGATVLYSFESSTTCTLAMLCGCPIVAMTHPDYPRLGFSEQTLSPYGGRGYALSDDADAIESARAGLPSFRAALARLQAHTLEELKAFVARTQAAADAAPQPQGSEATGLPTSIDDIPSIEAMAYRTDRHVHLTLVVIGKGDATNAATLESLDKQSRPADDVLRVDGIGSPLQRRLQAVCGTSRTQEESWIVLIDDGDTLHRNALASAAYLCGSRPELQWVYSDARVATTRGMETALYPPDLDPQLLRSGFAMVGLLAVRPEMLEGVLVDGEGLNADNWRQALPYLLLQAGNGDSGAHAAEPWVKHRDIPQGHPELLLPLPSRPCAQDAETPLISILIPSRDQLPALQRCLTSILENSGDLSFEIVIVAHETQDPSASHFLAELPAAAPRRIRVLAENGPFNFSVLINRAAAVARGRFLLLLNNDTAILQPDWLPRLLALFDDPAVGIVSPRLVFPDGRIQHAGVTLGLSGAADIAWVGTAMDEPGPLGLLAHTREVSAVTGAALMIREDLFAALGGMDEAYDIGFGDFDLCLRAAKAGARCVWTPSVTLMHEAGRTLKACFTQTEVAAQAGRAFEAARARFVRTWIGQLGTDPHYNINLSLASRHWHAEQEPELQPFPVLSPPGPRVLALPADDSGSGHYRVASPAGHAARERAAAARLARGYPIPVHFVRLGIDTLFSQRQVDDNHLKALTELRELLPGLRIVMDFDDLLTEVPRHSHHAAQVWPDIERRMRRACELSDCITTSTAPLAERLRSWHNDLRVVPNGIDPALWKPTHEPGSRAGKLRVGWAGGVSHAGDLALIRKVVEALADEVEWVFLGMCLQDMQPHLTEFHHSVPFAEYPDKLAALGLDLAIAPLEANAFNECKSNLRLLEYGALGIPVIASDQLPYRCGLPVTLVDNRPQAWIAAIRERTGERHALATDGARLREAVLAGWTVDRFLPDWIDAWRG
ncbi:glycosyltransferase [Pseudazoarcus pumilus]|nr:glycosyltransferase [Pseudazoarcus pumilus]